ACATSPNPPHRGDNVAGGHRLGEGIGPCVHESSALLELVAALVCLLGLFADLLSEREFAGLVREVCAFAPPGFVTLSHSLRRDSRARPDPSPASCGSGWCHRAQLGKHLPPDRRCLQRLAAAEDKRAGSRQAIQNLDRALTQRNAVRNSTF